MVAPLVIHIIVNVEQTKSDFLIRGTEARFDKVMIVADEMMQ